MHTFHLYVAFAILTQVAVSKRMEEFHSEDASISLLQTHIEVSKVSQTQAIAQTDLMSSGRRRRRRRRKAEEAQESNSTDPGEKTAETKGGAETNSTDPGQAEKSKILADTLILMDQVMTRTDAIYSWAKENADAEFYHQMDHLETSLRRLDVALDALSATTPTCKSNGLPGKYLVGLWIDSETCGQSRLQELTAALDRVLTQIQAKLHLDARRARIKWWHFWSSDSNPKDDQVNQDILKMILLANMQVDKETISCAPCSFETVSQSMVDSNAEIATYRAYVFECLQYGLGCTLMVIVAVVALSGTWCVLKIPKPDSTQTGLGILLVTLIVLSVITAFLYPYRQSTAFG